MSFLQEPVPPRGYVLPVLPGIGRIVAPNPGVMTYHGTNSWIIECGNELVVIDPGPDDARHLQDILVALKGRPLKFIVLTHTHHDHCGNALALKNATDAPVVAYKRPQVKDLIPDIALNDGDVIAGLKAIHTPGHASDHLCFQFLSQNKKMVLFSGDHVMSWSSSIVNPPDGDMLAYYNSLGKLLDGDDDIYLCGHGPLLENPRELVAKLLSNRQIRERMIIAELKKQDCSVASLAARLYHKKDLSLKAAAQRNVLAHLLKLLKEGVIEERLPETEPLPDIVAIMKLNEGRPKTFLQSLYYDSLRSFGLCR